MLHHIGIKGDNSILNWSLEDHMAVSERKSAYLLSKNAINAMATYSKSRMNLKTTLLKEKQKRCVEYVLRYVTYFTCKKIVKLNVFSFIPLLTVSLLLIIFKRPKSKMSKLNIYVYDFKLSLRAGSYFVSNILTPFKIAALLGTFT